ncbi:MAG: CocE/NonD family hydrolase [Acidobacteria bacterium]|nr:CocE/NonD family hydrolase [Acidobacteriota bacterium]
MRTRNQGGISDPWLHKVRNHGAFELGQQLGWAFDQLRLSPDPVVRAAFEAEEVGDWFAAMPLRRGLSPLAAAPEFEEYVLDQLTRGDHDRPDADVRHWTRLGVNWSAYYGRTADVPMLHVAAPSEDFPTGFEMNLTDGILRARYRNDPSRPEMMTPGEVYELTIEPHPTANRFQAGHRIRIDVSSSNFPRFDVNPNTGEPLGMHRRAVPADNSIHHETAYPSHVVLPLVAVTRE